MKAEYHGDLEANGFKEGNMVEVIAFEPSTEIVSDLVPLGVYEVRHVDQFLIVSYSGMEQCTFGNTLRNYRYRRYVHTNGFCKFLNRKGL